MSDNITQAWTQKLMCSRALWMLHLLAALAQNFTPKH